MRPSFSLTLALALVLGACGPREEPPVVGAPVAAPATVEVSPPGAAAAGPAAIATDEPPKKGRVREEVPLPTRDLRRSVMTPRSQALLATELQGLTRLLQATPPHAMDRPQLLRRIAEDYVELEHAATLNGATDVALQAQHEAIAHYTAIVQDHPSYPQMDEVLYYLAYEEELAHDAANARKRYFELIQKYPQSKYLPDAYLAFGEIFFAEASKGDPSKYDLAEKAYQEVVKYPPPDNKVYGFAFYMLAQVSLAKNDAASALGSLKKAIDHGRAYPQLPNSARIAEAARRDVTFAYAQVGDPRKAWNFFQPLSGDGTGDTQRTIDMMGKLGLEYTRDRRYAEATALYQDLRARDQMHACRWAAYEDDANSAASAGAPSPSRLQDALHACGP